MAAVVVEGVVAHETSEAIRRKDIWKQISIKIALGGMEPVKLQATTSGEGHGASSAWEGWPCEVSVITKEM